MRLDGIPAAPGSPVEPVAGPENAALFSGSGEAEERSRAFAGVR
jgi:hypothetical protein